MQARPGARRIYSNTGFEVLGSVLASASGLGFADYLAEAVFTPLGMVGSRLAGSPGTGAVASGADLVRFAAELRSPRLLHPDTLAAAASVASVAFPGLDGVLPGFGRPSPNDWGPGFELRGQKSPHWTGSRSSPGTFGHSGTFLWADRAAGCACAALTDRDFGDWAKLAWPALTDAVLAEPESG